MGRSLPPIFFEIHKDLPREGPGSNESTRRAYAMLRGVPAHPRILDVGCGPGMQTIELAKLSQGSVVGVDNHQPFLDALMRSVEAEGVSEQIGAVTASMFDLPYNDESFDIVWSEGAIFIIGFAEGLRQWRRLVKPGGFVAVTEASWLKPDPPDELRGFWTEVYPAITDIAGNLAMIEEAGYTPVGHFALPASDWWTHYYNPMLKRVEMLKDAYAHDSEALALLDAEMTEIDLHRRFSDYYGYVFYVMQRPQSPSDSSGQDLRIPPPQL